MELVKAERLFDNAEGRFDRLLAWLVDLATLGSHRLSGSVKLYWRLPGGVSQGGVGSFPSETVCLC